MNQRFIWIGVGCLLGLVIVSWLFPILLFTNRSLPGLYLEGVPIGGLSKGELQWQVREIALQVEDRELNITYRGQNHLISYKSLGISPNSELTLQEAFQYGKNGWLWERWSKYFKLVNGKANLNIKLKLERNKAQQLITQLTEPLKEAPQNAEFLLKENDEVQINPESWGIEPDILQALNTLEEELEYRETNQPLKLTLTEKKVAPEITTEQLISYEITGKISEKITKFNPGNKERTHNIRITAEKLDNLLIPPGEVFSFNKVIGPRTKEAGYLEAMIIVENEFEPGLGGGVCQVSSTLYNAALEANLAIKERRRHSLMVGYVPPGLDATVVYDYIDLKFQNTSGAYLWIKSKIEGDSLIVKIFGLKENLPLVKLTRTERTLIASTETIKDRTLPLGKVIVENEGKNGLIVEVQRTVMTNEGAVLNKEVISKDIYPARNRKVRVGANPALSSSEDSDSEETEQPLPQETQPTEPTSA